MGADESEKCERCGMLVRRIMAQYHQCKGSNRSLRPANITLEQWISSGGSLFGKMGTILADGLPKTPPPMPRSAKEILLAEHRKDLELRDRQYRAIKTQLDAKVRVVRFAILAGPFIFVAGLAIGLLWR